MPNLVEATITEHDFEDESVYRGLGFYDLVLAGREAESVEFDGCEFRRGDLSRVVLERPVFSGCDLDGSDLANARMHRATIKDTRLHGVRMTGFSFVDGSLRAVIVTDSRADMASFRFSKLRHVSFERCNLSRADFTNADIAGVQFVGCNLAGAQFSQAKMAGARFTECDLEGIGGVTSFAGAIVASTDLIPLTQALARGLGIVIQSPDDSTLVDPQETHRHPRGPAKAPQGRVKGQ